MTASTPAPLLYFGKLPSRGDFVRCSHAPGLIQTLDRWLSGSIEALATDPRWKLLYDRATPIDFAFLGSRGTRCMAGHLIASSDESGRRFPFITAGVLDNLEPGGFLRRCPTALSRSWQELRQIAHHAHATRDAGPLLNELAQRQIDLAVDRAVHDAAYESFLDHQTVGSLETQLRLAGHQISLRGTLLGLGLLLHPVPASGAHRLDKGLTLPLPADPLLQPLASGLWLDLIAGFLTRADFELALFVPRASPPPPSLSVGFDGAAPTSLRALMDRDASGDAFIDTCQSDWVEAFVEQDYAVKKLSSYLKQAGLSLRQARDTFNEAFLGG